MIIQELLPLCRDPILKMSTLSNNNKICSTSTLSILSILQTTINKENDDQSGIENEVDNYIIKIYLTFRIYYNIGERFSF